MHALRKLAALSVVVAGIALTSGCSIPPPAHCRFEAPAVTRSVAFADARTFEANLRDGSLTIEGWDRPDVEMTATVWAKGILPGAARRLATDTKVDLVKTGDKVVVRYEPARSLIDSERVGVDLHVRLPRQAATQASVQGAVRASGLAGAMKLHSPCGNIVLTDVVGPVDCDANCGKIDLTSITGDVRARANCGSVELRQVQGAVTVRANCGSVTVTDSRGSLDCQANCGNIRVTHTWTGETLKAQAECGKVDVAVATQAAANDSQ